MKLKEKLAIDIIAKHSVENPSWVMDVSVLPLVIRGFEKARELVQERFINNATVRPKHRDESDTINTVIVNGDRFEFTILEDFKTLGEEDVNE